MTRQREAIGMTKDMVMIMVMMAHLHNRGFLRAVGVLQFVEVIKRQARLLQPCKHSTQNTQQSNKLEGST